MTLTHNPSFASPSSSMSISILWMVINIKLAVTQFHKPTNVYDWHIISAQTKNTAAAPPSSDATQQRRPFNYRKKCKARAAPSWKVRIQAPFDPIRTISAPLWQVSGLGTAPGQFVQASFSGLQGGWGASRAASEHFCRIRGLKRARLRASGLDAPNALRWWLFVFFQFTWQKRRLICSLLTQNELKRRKSARAYQGALVIVEEKLQLW